MLEHGYSFPYEGFHCDSIVYPWGYLQLKGDPGPWIQHHYNLRSSVRFLDLSFEFYDIAVVDSIWELAELTHLYIGGHLTQLPESIAKLQKLEVLNVHCCRLLELPPNLDQLTSLRHLSIAAKSIKSFSSSLEKLYNLVTLRLERGYGLTEFPDNLDKLVSLRYLVLRFWDIESLPVSITKLSNLETLELYHCLSLKVLPANLNLRKLKLTNCSMMSPPTSLCHLELSHCELFDLDDEVDFHDQCLNQLVNLETLYISCQSIKFIPNISKLHNLRELHLTDCFKLEELPPDLDELINLCFLNLRGTRIKSLLSGITKLDNLQCITVPKCFRLESLPSKLNGSVKVLVDDIDETYYDKLGYYDYVTSSESSFEGNEQVDKESGKEVFAEQASPHAQMNQSDGSHSHVMPMLLGHQDSEGT